MLNVPAGSYVPAPYLTSGGLSASELTMLYTDFHANLRYISTAPELLFERLVGNVCDKLKIVIERERQQHSDEIGSAQAANRKLEAEISQLNKHLKQLQTECDQLRLKSNPPPGLPTTVIKQQRPNPAIGTFTTREIRYWFQVRAQTSKIVTLGRPYQAPPLIPLGLTAIDICKLSNVRLKSYTSGIQDDQFEIHLDSWDDTSLFSAGCTWLEIESDDSDFQFGTYSTLDNQIGKQWQQQNSHYVNFPKAYDAPPCVVVWISGFDMRREKNWRVKTYASDVTATGFEIHIDSWEDTVLYSGTATWVAYTAGKPEICSGSFCTVSSQPRRSHSGYEKFGKGIFGKRPRTVVALSKIDIACDQVMRLHVVTSDVSVHGMNWKLEGWQDTCITAAEASYIALI